MTYVGSVEPWSAGDGGEPVEPGLDSAIHDATDGGGEDGNAHAEMLIGFLTDFHAAARAPAVPEPEKTEPARSGALPSRFAAFVPSEPDLFAEADQLAAAAPLPVWPPVPAAPATAPPAPAPPASEPGSYPAASGRAHLDPAGEAAEKQPRFRRFGRRS